MEDCRFRVVHNIVAEGLGFAPFAILLAVLLGSGIGGWVLLHNWRNRRRGAVAFSIVWLILWLGAGGLGAGNMLFQRWRCLSWAKRGDYRVVQGVVKDFDPMPTGGHADESFTVGGLAFDYSDFDLSKGGFNSAASHGGPIREGLLVRISYREGRILKIEVCE